MSHGWQSTPSPERSGSRARRTGTRPRPAVRLPRRSSASRGRAPRRVPRRVRVRAAGASTSALVGHDALDWAPLGLDDGAHVRQPDDLSPRRPRGRARALATARIGAGEWPWSFFCYREDAPASRHARRRSGCSPRRRRDGRASPCAAPSCGSTSINVVTRPHVDVPFHSDASVGVVAHVFEDDALRTIDAFRAELDSASFDERRLVALMDDAAVHSREGWPDHGPDGRSSEHGISRRTAPPRLERPRSPPPARLPRAREAGASGGRRRRCGSRRRSAPSSRSKLLTSLSGERS